MNQINLDKLLQLAPAGKADAATLKLVIAQLYQARITQLSEAGVVLRLPTPQAPLQLNLPASASTTVQHWLHSTVLSEHSAKASKASATTGDVLKQAVQVQFAPTSDNKVLVTLHSPAKVLSYPLPAAQARQLLMQLFVSLSQATASQALQDGSSSALVSARLLNQSSPASIQLPALPALPIPPALQKHLGQLLSSSHSSQLTVLLQLSSSADKLSANLLLPGTAAAGNHQVILEKPQQAQLLQQLVRLFNQQQLSPSDNRLGALTSLKLPATAANYHLQLQPQANQQWQLQLVPDKASVQFMAASDDFNRPLQFVSQPQQTRPGQTTTLTTPVVTSTAVQQAWRHLLPLLPAQPEPLQDLPELPIVVQQVLQQLRQSLPDGNKVLSPAQLMPQLLSLLQFQPLQSNANVQTSGGALAVAIQLLLGHLAQKPQPAAQTLANQKLAQLVSNLEPAQASTLLRQLASHSSTLQQSQLATLDSNSQAQQQILLQLPLQQGDRTVFSQLQLEQREADGKQKGEKRSWWQLTMKFDLQQLGPLLVVAKLQQQQLQLQFYTEQPQAKALALQFLPLLKDRCKMQGLEVSQADCVLGKIPDSLLPRANSLLAIKV